MTCGSWPDYLAERRWGSYRSAPAWGRPAPSSATNTIAKCKWYLSHYLSNVAHIIEVKINIQFPSLEFRFPCLVRWGVSWSWSCQYWFLHGLINFNLIFWHRRETRPLLVISISGPKRNRSWGGRKWIVCNESVVHLGFSSASWYRRKYQSLLILST